MSLKNLYLNLTKIYEQIDFNEDLKNSISVTQGSFQWENGVKDTKVMFVPNKNGRFRVSWIPPLKSPKSCDNKGWT